MTQDSDRQSSSGSRRSARAGRNRPMLITSQEGEGIEEASIEETSPTLEPGVEAENTPPTKRRMPAFFSTIGKRTHSEEAQEVDQAQARIARATRGKATSTKTASEDTKDQKPAVKKEPARNRPASPFKTKYLIGIGIYLLAANFIGIFETNIMRAYHLDFVLTQFVLFGGKVIISTSTVVFLATLVIILVALARFDLIPRNFSALMGGQTAQQNKRGTSSNQGTAEGNRTNPPNIKQGVKGANDDLYQEYRSNQKRAKKK